MLALVLGYTTHDANDLNNIQGSISYINCETAFVDTELALQVHRVSSILVKYTIGISVSKTD